MASLRSLNVPFSEENSVVLLPSGTKKFHDMFEAIRQAKRFVHLEYFNYRNDSIGWALFGLLGQKAAEGVEIKVMCDDFGNRSNDHPLKRHHLDSIRSMGIDIVIFDPMNFPWINHFYHRDHMKIVVIDGNIAYSGGMNVADYYIHGKPEIGSWHDMHMRLQGPVVQHYEDIFTRMWQQEAKQTLQPEHHLPDTTVYQNLPPDTTPDAGKKHIAVVHRRPGKDSKLMRQAYVAAIDAAKHHIQLVNPYPTGVYSVRSALYRALKRGVRIEFMVSAKSDVPITPDVVGIQMLRLMKRGCEVYYYEEGFHHSKYMIVDDEFCTIGSANLDARSMLFDYEVNSFIFSPSTTRQLQKLFEHDKKKCTLLTKEGWKKRFNIWHRMLGRIFGAFRGFF
ncbi:MAG: cardiolipin synthase [Bacteroidales bacterium]|nr:cardiolipin synthase [Candidatus Physcousia equi]